MLEWKPSSAAPGPAPPDPLPSPGSPRGNAEPFLWASVGRFFRYPGSSKGITVFRPSLPPASTRTTRILSSPGVMRSAAPRSTLGRGVSPRRAVARRKLRLESCMPTFLSNVLGLWRLQAAHHERPGVAARGRSHVFRDRFRKTLGKEEGSRAGGADLLPVGGDLERLPAEVALAAHAHRETVAREERGRAEPGLPARPALDAGGREELEPHGGHGLRERLSAGPRADRPQAAHAVVRRARDEGAPGLPRV